MFLTKLFLAAVLAVALSAQTATAPKASFDDAKSIIKKADRDLGPQIDEAMSRYRDGASKFDLLENSLEKSLGCQNSIPEGSYEKMTDTQKTKVHECRSLIRKAQLAFTANYFMQVQHAEKMINLGMTRLVSLAASLIGQESGAIHRYANHLEASTRNNFAERFITLNTKTLKVLDELSQ